MANLKLKKQMIEAVDSQLKANNPPFVKEVYQQLQEEGSSKKEAKEMIASVLLGEIFEVLKYGKEFDEQHYKEELFALLDDEEDFLEDILDYVNDEEEDEILKVKHQVYEALYEHKPTEAVRIFLTVWEDIKKFVKDNFYKQDKNGKIIKPEVIDIDDQTDFKYELYNWLQDMEMEFQNSRLFEESIAYFNDVIDLFAWVEDSCDYYKAAIGEVYNTMGRYEECDNYFENWLESEPNNIACINIYTLCLLMRGEEAKAQGMVEKYIPITMKLDIENEVLFHRAVDVYATTGNEQKRDEYQNVLDAYLDKQETCRYPDYSFGEELPIVKDKKVYPNDPCPCGSGKKYKKCCGK